MGGQKLSYIFSSQLHSNILIYMSRAMRKPDFCKYENKSADQLHGNYAADQRLCFFVPSLYFLHPKFQAPSHLQRLYSPVCVGPGQNS